MYEIALKKRSHGMAMMLFASLSVLSATAKTVMPLLIQI